MTPNAPIQRYSLEILRFNGRMMSAHLKAMPDGTHVEHDDHMATMRAKNEHCDWLRGRLDAKEATISEQAGEIERMRHVLHIAEAALADMRNAWLNGAAPAWNSVEAERVKIALINHVRPALDTTARKDGDAQR